MEVEFSRQIFGGKNIKIRNFMKIRPVGAEWFHAKVLGRRREGRDEANSRFLQFCERAKERKNVQLLRCQTIVNLSKLTEGFYMETGMYVLCEKLR
jgi:hypothetical protein